MADLEVSSPEAAYASKANIAYPKNGAGGLAQVAGPGAAARADIEGRLGQTDPEVTTTPPSAPLAPRTLDAAPTLVQET